MRGLYPILDLETVHRTGLEPLAVAERVLEARPSLLQLRAKRASAKLTLALLEALLPLCRRQGTLLFANDRPDLAVLAGADGVHLGQEDLPIAAVRRMAPGLRIGVSTHDMQQLEEALAEAPDYVAFGPVFATTSKRNPDPVVGTEGLARAAARAERSGIPLVAIGGIDLERAPAIAERGALGAVISALLVDSLPGIAARARALHDALGGAR
ncbi:MAG TPA: thiamine phosphate synthase [Polyangiaceae bacterium]